MLIQPLLDKLTQLRLSVFRVALEEQLHNPQYADLPFEDRRGLLVDRECMHRDNNRLKRRLKAARLPLPATMEDLDLSPARGLDRRLVLQLAQGEWIHQHLNTLVLGPTGVGKTHLAQALGQEACRQGLQVLFINTHKMLQHLNGGRVDGSWERRLQVYLRPDLLVLDDFGLKPLPHPAPEDL